MTAGVLTGIGIFFILILLGMIRALKSIDLSSLVVWLNLLRKVTLRDYFESTLRAETGKPLDRPYGSRRAFFSWERIIFNPVYMTRNPLNFDAKIDTEVILGPKSHKPLKLKVPILIAGMAYGSGYSLQAKIALAKAATMAGTAANSGNGPFLEEERKYAEKFILQYSRGFWAKSEEILKQADMIEIALGHSASSSAPVRIKGSKITKEVGKRYGTIPGLDLLIEARLPEVETMEEWQELVQRLKEATGGVPVAVKFGASHYLEREMDLFIQGGVDVLVFDGLEGGTHGGMPLFMDDMGLPIFPALCRAVNHLQKRGLKNQISLVVGGGLVNPGDFAKCLALGADAVLIGTITALVQVHTQVTKAVPCEPPTGVLYNDGKEKHEYDPDLGAEHLYKYFKSCVTEMELLARSLGKKSLRELNRSDLATFDPLYAQIAGISYIL